MLKEIHSFENEDGELLVVGTHDRAMAIAELKKMYAYVHDMDVEDKHFEGIVSRPSYVRHNWDVWDDDADIFVPEGQRSIPALVFDEGVTAAWEADQ